MEAVQTMASEVLVNLALGVITLLGAYAMLYISKASKKIKEQTQQIMDDKQRQLLVDALDDVETLAIVTVGSIEQTTAKTIREAVKSGTKDREELMALGKKAFEEIKASVTPQTQRVISENLGSFDDYLANLIEAQVLALKTSVKQ